MTFCTERRVEFRDTDAAGIVHFSAFFPMMESAEHEMLRSLGLTVLPRSGSSSDLSLPARTWPRVAASCHYRSAARFEDILKISVDVMKLGRTSVEYCFRFTREDELIAEGMMTAVCCELPQSVGGPDSGHLQKTPIPEPIRELLAKHH